MVKVAGLPTFDMAKALQSEQDIIDYLNLVLEENDSAELANALNVVARAKDTAQITNEADIDREALYKALSADASPRFDTINKVLHAFGLKLKVMQQSRD